MTRPLLGHPGGVYVVRVSHGNRLRLPRAIVRALALAPGDMLIFDLVDLPGGVKAILLKPGKVVPREVW